MIYVYYNVFWETQKKSSYGNIFAYLEPIITPLFAIDTNTIIKLMLRQMNNMRMLKEATFKKWGCQKIRPSKNMTTSNSRGVYSNKIPKKIYTLKGKTGIFIDLVNNDRPNYEAQDWHVATTVWKRCQFFGVWYYYLRYRVRSKRDQQWWTSKPVQLHRARNKQQEELWAPMCRTRLLDHYKIQNGFWY